MLTVTVEVVELRFAIIFGKYMSFYLFLTELDYSMVPYRIGNQSQTEK